MIKGIGHKKRKKDEVDEATRGRLNEEVAILAIETGGRMHSQFHRLITAFARFKADKIAGPLPVDRTRQGLGFDNRTDGVYPAVKVKGDFTCARNPLSGAGSKSHESRASRKGSIMRITIPHPRCTRNEAVSN